MDIFDPPAQKLGHGFAPPPNHLFRTVSIFLKLDSLRKTRKTHKMKKRLGGGTNGCAKMEFAEEIETKNVCENQTKFIKQ